MITEITTYHDAVFALANYYDKHPRCAESDPEVIRLRGLMDKLESRKPSNSGFAPHDEFHSVEEAIKYWFDQGLTRNSIAEQLGIDRAAVDYRMKKMDLRRGYRAISVKTLRHEVIRGMSINQIYERHKVVPGELKQMIAENGLSGRYKAIQAAKGISVYITPDGGHREYESRLALRKAEGLRNMNKYNEAKQDGRVMNRFEWLRTQGVRL